MSFTMEGGSRSVPSVASTQRHSVSLEEVADAAILAIAEESEAIMLEKLVALIKSRQQQASVHRPSLLLSQSAAQPRASVVKPTFQRPSLVLQNHQDRPPSPLHDRDLEYSDPPRTSLSPRSTPSRPAPLLTPQDLADRLPLSARSDPLGRVDEDEDEDGQLFFDAASSTAEEFDMPRDARQRRVSDIPELHYPYENNRRPSKLEKKQQQAQRRPQSLPAPSSSKNLTRKTSDMSESRRSTNDAPFRSSIQEGMFEVEQLADRTKKREEKRVLVTRTVRGRFLRTCRQIAAQNLREYGSKKKIHMEDLRAFRDRIQDEVTYSHANLKVVAGFFGFKDDNVRLLDMLNRGMEEMEQSDDEWFMFEEFNLLHTKRESRWPWMRSSTRMAAVMIVFWYLFTAVLFCAIIDDEGVCPSDPEDQDPYYGWLSSLYFASATMSTVGYGDVSVSKDERWRIFIGAMYMIGSLLVAIFAVSAAIDEAFSPFAKIAQKIAEKGFSRNKDKTKKEAKDITNKIRRIQFTRITEICLQVTFLNLLGIFVSRYFTTRAEEEDEQWTWMTAFYWSIQTTTTIGYGDLSMPFELRWFQIFYLTISTYAVGNALGKLANLKTKLRELRSFYTWRERELTRTMIEDMQAYVHDDIIDEYEFIVSSLLTLGKLQSEDVHLIMDKFKELAGSKGYIALEDGAE